MRRLRLYNVIGFPEMTLSFIILISLFPLGITESVVKDSSSDIQAIQLKISPKAKQEYEKYQVETCRKNHTKNAINAYLSWEELCFLKELRTTLFPETSNGAYESLLSKPDGADLMQKMGYRMLDTSPRSICQKRNASQGISVEKLTESISFQDSLFNMIWNTARDD